MTTSLRAELLGLPESLPRFRLLLPAGWQSHPITAETAERFEQQARGVFMRAGRPDLDGVFTSDLQRSMRGLERTGARYVILPENRPDGVPLPLSLIVSLISGDNGVSLDDWVAARFRQGAQMLDQNGQIVFWRTRRPAGEPEVHQVQSTYVVPVPETGRNKALMFTGTGLVGSEAPEDDDMVVASNAMFDAIVSTVSWVLVPADGGAE